MEDLIIYIILFLFLFGGAILKKIGEVISGGGEQRAANRDDVKEYLQKMRQHSTQSQDVGYRAPATKPASRQARKPRKKAKRMKKAQPQLEKASAASSAYDIKPQAESRQARIEVLERVMTNPNFSEIQKAIIFKEVFDKPKAFASGPMSKYSQDF